MWPFNPKPAKKTTHAPRRRGFAAAKTSRLLADLSGSSASVNEILRGDLKTLRNRCRELEYNNSHARRFLSLVEMNVIGPNGIVLQSAAVTKMGTPDVPMRGKIHAEFKKWAKKKNCSVDGIDSWLSLQRLAVRTVALTGEVFIRVVVDPSSPWGMRLQLLDPDYCPIDLNQDAGGGKNTIRLGIEINKFGKPLAYHLTVDHPGDRIFTTGRGQYERVPAEEIVHLFYRQRPGQLRGIPWMAAALVDTHHLDQFLSAALIKQRVEASKMGFITQDEGSAGYDGQGRDEADGSIVSEVSAGVIELLEPGQDFKQFDPSSTDTIDSFTKIILHRLAVGMGVSYHSLAGDLEGVNYSSIRAGKLEDQDLWQVFQGWAIEALCEPVFDWWIQLQTLSGSLGALGMGELPRIESAEWLARRWAWVDPEKEVTAHIMGINAGLESRRGVIREMGRNPEQVTDEIETDPFKPIQQVAAVAPSAPAEEKPNPKDEEDETNAA